MVPPQTRPEDRPTATTVRYRWLLERNPEALGLFVSWRTLGNLLVTEAVFAATLASPWVTRATGLSALTSLGLVAVHAAWSVVVAAGLRERAARSTLVFHLVALGNLVTALGIALAFTVLGGDPNTPLWMLPVLYAAMNGATPASSPSIVLLLLTFAAPLLTIPFFAPSAGAWAYGGPLLCAGASAATYIFIAQRSGEWSALRAQHAEALVLLRAREAELERLRLAQDLHDSVGSALGLLAAHADLVERRADDGEQVRQLAQVAREVAHDGLAELRGLLEALAPVAATVDELAEALREFGARQLASTGVSLVVTVAEGGAHSLDADLRLALVRVFREAVRNATHHGGARHLSAALGVRERAVTLEVLDDGTGFDVALARPRGRGLSGMRARAHDRGGEFEVVCPPERGTRLRLRLPLDRPVLA